MELPKQDLRDKRTPKSNSTNSTKIHYWELKMCAKIRLNMTTTPT